MPRLSPRQVDELRQAMLAKRVALLEAAHAELDYGERSPYAAVLEEVADEADRATAATTAEFDNEIARRHGVELRDVDAALARIAGHRYGTCEDCGSDISYARMAAFPTATRCIDCQRLRERVHAHEATPSL
jgi:DnaK suppressor protein